MKMKPSRNGEITLSFTDSGKSCSSRDFFKETKPATMNFFRIFYFLFKSFVKVEFSYIFKINLFTRAENCTEK